jgi:hypothetical protein
MTAPITAKSGNTRARQVGAVAGWLGLAASPTFALMAIIAASDAPRMAICAPASVMLPIDGMAWMYLLMSIFHLSPWLKLASGRPRQLTTSLPQVEGD